MTDLTKIEKPLGLLDAETQEALRSHGGPYESFHSDGWKSNHHPSWAGHMAYRVKPQPPKPREWWIEPLYSDVSPSPAIGYIHVREVLDE